MNRKLKTTLIVVGIIVILVVSIKIMSSNKSTVAAIEAKAKTWTVDATTIKIDKLAPVYTLLGQVESDSLVKAASPVNGVVEQVWVQAGEQFKKGDKLLTLSKQDLQLPVEIAQSNVTANHAKLALQKLRFTANKQTLKHEQSLLAIKANNVKRNQRLNSQKLSSVTSLENAKESLVQQQKVVVQANLKVAEHQATISQLTANLQTAKINLKQAKINLQRGQLVAPFDGKVAKLLVSAGDRVNTGSGLIHYYANDSLALRAKVPSVYLPSIRQAFNKGGQLFATYSDTVGTQKYQLQLTRFAGEASASGLDVFLSIPKELTNASLGNLMEVSLKASVIEGVFSVPFSALYGADKVFVIDKETRQLIAKTVIKIGETAQNELILKGELSTGDQIMLTHLPNAISGLKVFVIEQGAK